MVNNDQNAHHSLQADFNFDLLYQRLDLPSKIWLNFALPHACLTHVSCFIKCDVTLFPDISNYFW